MMTCSRFVDSKDLSVWYDLFKTSGGRFMCKPIAFAHGISVVYEISVEDENRLCREFERLRKPIVESRRNVYGRIKAKFSRFFGQ